MNTAESDPEVSAVIPAKNEAENLPDLVAEIHAALAGRDYEIVVVDDGSTDDTPQVLARLSGSDDRLVYARHPGSLGRSAAVHTATRMARGRRIVTLDGDGQNDPIYIPILADRLDDPGVGLVARPQGHRGQADGLTYRQFRASSPARRRYPRYGVRIQSLSARSLS
jgi:glycosyltransferase involved in cell wall biosynthesis